MKKRTTILGTAFRCTACDKVFIAGTLGMEALTARVTQHMHDTGHMDIPPVNPPIGMCYKKISDSTSVGTPYDGGGKDEWFEKLKTIARKVFGIKPAWNLEV